jgi:hypothetical protein
MSRVRDRIPRKLRLALGIQLQDIRHYKVEAVWGRDSLVAARLCRRFPAEEGFIDDDKLRKFTGYVSGIPMKLALSVKVGSHTVHRSKAIQRSGNSVAISGAPFGYKHWETTAQENILIYPSRDGSVITICLWEKDPSDKYYDGTQEVCVAQAVDSRRAVRSCGTLRSRLSEWLTGVIEDASPFCIGSDQVK